MLVGVDGCPAGWVAVIRDGQEFRQLVSASFREILETTDDDAIIAVDMPIGLPDRIGAGGRGPERAIRPFLGARQSSVFSIPARPAIECDDYRETCRVALDTSDPARKVSRQGFNLFAKIREVDALISPDLQERVREVHPELAFCVLNGGSPMRTPKKVKGRVHPDGIDERRDLLVRSGIPADFLAAGPARGAASDDFIDACACCLIAGRIAKGEARSHPAHPGRDARGLHVAIWA